MASHQVARSPIEDEPLLGAAAAMLREPTKTAIVIIDIQNDFMEGGALQVPGASFSSYLGECEEFLKLARDSNFVIAQSKDCHPPGHSSFASSHPGKELLTLATLTRKGMKYQQMMWPDHCVQGTKGVELVMPALDDEIVQNKGGKLDVDSYSAFIDDAGEETGLGATLKAKGVTNVIIFGLATDFCVWFSCKNAKELGFNVAVVPELSRGIAAETAPGLALTAPPSGDDKVFSWAQYREKGVHILPLGDIKDALRMMRGSVQAADGSPPRAVAAEASEADQRRRKEDKQRHAQAAERRRALKQFLHKNGFAGVNDSRRVCLLWRSYPLHVAVQKNNLRVVEMLLAEGADPSLKNSSGRTAAEVAQKNNKKGKHATMVKILQSAAKGTAGAAAVGGA